MLQLLPETSFFDDAESARSGRYLVENLRIFLTIRVEFLSKTNSESYFVLMKTDPTRPKTDHQPSRQRPKTKATTEFAQFLRDRTTRPVKVVVGDHPRFKVTHYFIRYLKNHDFIGTWSRQRRFCARPTKYF